MSVENQVQELFNTYFESFIKSNINKIKDDDENKEYKEKVYETLIRRWNKDKVQDQIKEGIVELNLKAKKEKKKKKTNKDPNKPKKPKTAYIVYCSIQRAIIQKKEPEKKFTEITKYLGPLWKKLKTDVLKGDEEAVKQMENCKKIADEDKLRYINEMENYVEPSEEEIKEIKESKKKAKKKKNKNNGIKRIVTCYQLFVKKNRAKIKAENPDLSFAESSTKTSILWKEFKKKVEEGDEEAKKEMDEYTEIVSKDKIRYYTEKQKLQDSSSESDEE